ncbi:MAG TPA: 4-(cytidine 5'-diphospho)-2-C-methyl-D-erythritol kinase [Segeticoccus sp.]|uniref:4-(cytidine 5'-diphospho)-2-C-methyl-D-erythritol kinase n=1 Tax=Segeticoccus sp. TaxID=2706531 RepID=UPI002D810B51|nr:4-(cytidine 5'-diphospho)-2-C-methyl-D-erythritol kinase [Segeticoccus sp.]HET8600418.1 4-(cytidine 5'-diphospho)-2-C-methyl-D-erythritol kinase [Segeticoccus sp.]
MSAASASGRSVTVRAPAKLNLELTVGPRRPDGYHDLATVFHAVGLHDEVTVEPADDWEVVVTGPYAELVPCGADNLAMRAAHLIAEQATSSGPARITIDKEIPVAGGMAGGSADGAATLLACDLLWEVGLSRGELEELAADLGSDVPFALAGGTAIGSGRGEQLVPVLAPGRYEWVLALSEGGLPTPEVYAECDRLRAGRRVPDPEPSEDLMSALRAGDPRALGAALTNDLQDAAFSLRPELRGLLEVGLDFGALGGIVSGSGPTIAFLTADVEGALDLSVALAASGAAPEVKRATGPAHGVHVVRSPSLRSL